jgi:hypothetical protein
MRTALMTGYWAAPLPEHVLHHVSHQPALFRACLLLGLAAI